MSDTKEKKTELATSAKHNDLAQQCYEQSFAYNQEGQYDEAISAAMQGLKAISKKLCLTSEEELSTEGASNEIDLFLGGDSLNFRLAINLRNEIACSALALNEWEIYHYNNTLTTTLYKLYHQDSSLPTYCEKLQQTKTTSRQLLVLMVMFTLLFMALSFILLRHRLHLGKGLMLQRQLCLQLEGMDAEVEAHDLSEVQTIANHILHTTFDGMNNWQHVGGMKLQLLREDESELMTLTEGNVEGYKDAENADVTSEKVITLSDVRGSLTLYGVTGKIDDQLNLMVFQTLSRLLSIRVVRIAEAIEAKEHQLDELNHLRYEENRLHIQNQILDNCLSTIKHESMYYPSRIQQLTQRILSEQDNDLQQLTELAHYYKEVYTLLSTQADKLTTQTYYRKEKLSMLSILQKAKKHFAKQAKKQHLDYQLEIKGDNDFMVSADCVLVEELMERFNLFFLKRLFEQPEAGIPTVSVKREGHFAKVIFCLPGFIIDETKAHTMFYPESGHINLLIAKQIIRELDALFNFPGLRLIAEATEDSTIIWFNLVST